MNANVPDQPLVPGVLLGAGKQSEHVLRLMQWLGLPTREIVLFDDGYPERMAGALGNDIEGTLDQGLTFCVQNKLPAMVALGSRNAALRYSMFRMLISAGVTMPSLGHPTCAIAPTALIGANALIMPGSVVSAGVRSGALATLFANVTIEHDCAIGENVTFGPGATVSGFVKIGSHAFIGAGATIAPEVTIGDRCVIGAGAVVVNNIDAGTVAFGVPARPCREVRPGDDAPTEESLRQARVTGVGWR